MNKSTDIGVGSVIKLENNSDVIYVIIGINSRENESSMSYDRYYYILRYDYMMEINNHTVSEKQLMQKCIEIYVGPKHKSIPFREVNDIPPFNIEKIKMCKITQKEAKQVTIYV